MESMKGSLTGWAHDAKRNAGWLMMLGVLTVVAGVLAVGSPWIGGLWITMVIGVALIVAGLARVAGAFHAGSFGQGALAFVGGVLTLVAGAILATRPGVGLATLTLMFGAYLLVDGTFGAVLAFHVRPEKGWGWMLVSAMLGLLLGILLLAEWPLSGLWAIGTLVGINLLFAGFSLFSIGSAARTLLQPAE